MEKIYIKTTEFLSGNDAITELIRRGGKNSKNLKGANSREPLVYYVDLKGEINCFIDDPNVIAILKSLGFTEIKKSTQLLETKNIIVNLQIPPELTEQLEVVVAKKFFPKKGEKYYMIVEFKIREKIIHEATYGVIPELDQFCLESGNCFRSREEAENAKLISGI